MASERDFPMTQEEIKSLSSAMEKPEFRELLNDYIDEISDPKNKEEYEQYLKQLEENGELPGRDVVRPKPEFCIRTEIVDKKVKVYINVCSTKVVKRPKSKAKQGGSSWKVPYAMAKPRMDQDKHAVPCKTFDIAFHKQAFKFSKSNVKFQQLLWDSAISGANQLLLEHNEKVSQDYRVVKSMKCKGETPGSIIIPKHALNGQPRPQAPPNVKNLSEEGPKLYRELMHQQTKSAQEAATAESEEEEEEKDEEDLSWQTVTGIQAPDYKIIYSNNIGYGDFIETRFKTRQRPEEIVLKVTLPRLEKIAEADLDVEDELVILSVPERYYLEVPLKFPVHKERAKAQFDAKRKLLTLRLPVVPGEVEEAVPEKPDSPEPEESDHEASEAQEPIIDVVVPESASLDEEPLVETVQEPEEQQEVTTEPLVVLDEVRYTESVPDQIDTPIEPTIEEIHSEVSLITESQESFTIRDEEQMTFVLFHLPGLDITSVRWEVFSDEISITWKLNDQDNSFMRRLPAAIDVTKSGVDVIIDYISIRLFKVTSGPWGSVGEEIDELSPHERYTATPSKVDLNCKLLYELF